MHSFSYIGCRLGSRNQKNKPTVEDVASSHPQRLQRLDFGHVARGSDWNYGVMHRTALAAGFRGFITYGVECRSMINKLLTLNPKR